jgi:Rad3-related DNA helicase
VGEFVFDTQIARTQYLSNVFKYFYRIPFIVTPTAWPQTTDATPVDKVINKTNFVSEIFSDNIDIAYAQQGIVQGENYTTISLNSQALNNIVEIAALSNITSPYNPTAEVSELIQASQPDRFQSFSRYDEGGSKVFKFLNEHCKETQTTINPLNEQNIFSSRYQSGYSTRTPQWEFITVIDADKSPNGKKSIKVACNFWSFVKFSIGGTPNAESTLTGVERFGVTNRLANDLGSKVFAIKKVAGVNRYASIVQDTSDTDNTDAWMALKLISPPSYIHDEMIDKKTNLMKPTVSRIHVLS